jgi:serine/threonine protein kinase
MSDQASEIDDLERIFADADAVPIKISYALIKSITKNFAQVLGNGAFGVVYLGGLRNGMVAVKKLSISMNFSDTQFLEEVKCLKRVRHKNIVRFLGYCADAHGEVMEVEGKLRIVEVQQRLLCFEYVPNGSLDQCLQEKTHRYEWNTCYRIIKGICQGLHFLHEERISHLDLKPANVLLGAHMKPKITDFGLSRLLDGNQSTIFTTNLFGTPGYIAPELIDKKKISLKSDIYSLGIIMERLMKGIYENITESWLESLCVECKKMKRCLEISEKCANSDPSKIPTVDEITLMLNQTATTIQKVLPVVIDPRNDLTSSLYKWLKSQCVDCRQRKRCLQIAEKCADSDLSERSTVEEIFHMLNETQTTTQRIPTAVNEPRNDPRSSVYQWLKSLCVECKRKKESLEIAEKSANPDPSKRPSRDEIIHMLNETETTIRKVLAVVNEPINQPRSSLYQWLKSQCLDCKQKKAFLETVEKCAVSDPGKIHSIAELILMLNETETITQKIPQVRESREATRSSLYQWLESLCVDCREVKRCLETAQKFANPDPSEGPNVDKIFLMLNEAQTPPNVPGVVKDRINDTKSPLYQV